MTSKLTQEEAVDKGLAAPHPALLLEPYKNNRVKHRYRFLRCNHEWEMKPNNLHNGNGCGVCFHNQGPTYLYLMEHEGHNAFKIGMTAVKHSQQWNSRIHKLRYRGWTLVHKVRFETRAEAEGIEKAILTSWRDQYFPVALTSEQLSGGHGETVSRMYISPTEIAAMMDPINIS